MNPSMSPEMSTLWEPAPIEVGILGCTKMRMFPKRETLLRTARGFHVDATSSGESNVISRLLLNIPTMMDPVVLDKIPHANFSEAVQSALVKHKQGTIS